MGLTKGFYGNYNNEVTELGGGSSVGELIYTYTYNKTGYISLGVLPVSDVISSLNGHKFIYIDFNMQSWSSNSSNAYWYSDLFSGEYRLNGSFNRKAAGIVVSETDIATISSSGSSSGYYTFSISARSSNGYVVTGNMTGNIAMNFTLNIYSA